MKKRKVFFNNKFVTEDLAKISIYDSALMFGDMVFEMTRSFNRNQFKLEEHIDRLFYGLKILRIDIPMSKKDIIEKCNETIDQNKDVLASDDEDRLMIDVSRGLLGIYQDIEGLEKGPNIIIANFPLRWTVRNMGKLFDEGINLVITSQRAIPSMYMDPKIKNRSRLFYLTANIEAGLHKGKNNWAILLDKDGFVSEGTGDNFFIVKNNHVITPKGTHILRGISRDYIFELCEQLNLDCYEKDIEPYDVYTADEAFITGTPFCMLPVFSMNALSIGEGKRGPIFDKLLNKWSKNVGLDIENQIKIWNANDEKVVNLNQNIATPYSFKKVND